MRCDEMPHPHKKLTPCQAIKFYCKHLCCAGDTISWKDCTATRCTLWPYRKGTRPQKLPFSAYHTPSKKTKENEADLTREKPKISELQAGSGPIMEQSSHESKEGGKNGNS